METGWDAESRCAGFWHVWFCSVRSFLVATVAVDLPSQPARCEEAGRVTKKDNPSSQKWKASVESPLKYSLSERAGLDQIIGMAM